MHDTSSSANSSCCSARNCALPIGVALFLAVQILVPIIQLGKTRPAHFGWQMFSDWRPIPTYWIVLADGSTREIDLHEHIAVRRLDADYHSVFPDYLLRTYSEALAVRWQWPDSAEVQEYRWPR
jgi:hypothetical protein